MIFKPVSAMVIKWRQCPSPNVVYGAKHIHTIPQHQHKKHITHFFYFRPLSLSHSHTHTHTHTHYHLSFEGFGPSSTFLIHYFCHGPRKVQQRQDAYFIKNKKGQDQDSIVKILNIYTMLSCTHLLLLSSIYPFTQCLSLLVTIICYPYI